MKGRPGLYKVYKNLEDKNSFIRGLFDGDGTVTEMSNSKTLLRIGFSINSSCNDIKMILEDFCQSNDIKLGLYFDKRGSGAWFASINSKANVHKFFELIYSNNPKLFLKRKYDVFVRHGFPNLVTN